MATHFRVTLDPDPGALTGFNPIENPDPASSFNKRSNPDPKLCLSRDRQFRKRLSEKEHYSVELFITHVDKLYNTYSMHIHNKLKTFLSDLRINQYEVKYVRVYLFCIEP